MSKSQKVSLYCKRSQLCSFQCEFLLNFVINILLSISEGMEILLELYE